MSSYLCYLFSGPDVSVRFQTMELSRHTLQFAPQPGFSSHFRFAPLGAFYCWRTVVHTPVLQRSGCISIRELYFWSCAMSSILKTFRVLGRIVRNMSPRAMRLSRELLHRQIFIIRATGDPLSSPANFPFVGAELLLPVRSGTSWFRLRVLLPRVFPYAAASPFLRHLPPPAPAGSVFSCGLICRLALVNLGANCPFVKPPFFPPVCCTSIWRVPCQHSCWFKSFHYVVPAVPVLVSWFEDFFADRRHIVLSSRFRISCTVVGSFFSSSSEFRFVRLPDRVCQYFCVAFRFLEKFASSSVPMLIRSNFIPVPIRRGSVLLAIVPFYRRTRCSLVIFNKSLRSVSAS